MDHAAQRYGLLTTQDIKLGMMTLLNNMLHDQRVNLLPELVSYDPQGNRKWLREQLAIYSFQFKSAPDTCMALNGKVSGMKDDVCIALQLGVYFSSKEILYA